MHSRIVPAFHRRFTPRVGLGVRASEQAHREHVVEVTQCSQAVSRREAEHGDLHPRDAGGPQGQETQIWQPVCESLIDVGLYTRSRSHEPPLPSAAHDPTRSTAAGAIAASPRS